MGRCERRRAAVGAGWREGRRHHLPRRWRPRPRDAGDGGALVAEQDAAAGLARGVATFNWLPWFTTDTQRTSFISKDVGRALGRARLAANDGLRSLHVVGTSAGLVCGERVLRGLRGARGGRARATVRLSRADPFAAALEASPNDGRGAQFFGRDADFAEHLLNRDDIVPNTNTPLPFCYCLDVTKTAERKTFPPPDPTGDAFDDLLLRSLGYHNWPLGYLARHYETVLDGQGPRRPAEPRGAAARCCGARRVSFVRPCGVLASKRLSNLLTDPVTL